VPTTQEPAGLIRIIHLEDGTEVTLRPIRPEDAAAEWEFVHRLSLHSKYLRFLTSLKDLTPELVVRFTCPDYGREMALVAVTQTAQGEQQIGVARYSILPGTRNCEFAIVVDDHWQGTGLGHELMNALIEIARAHHKLQAMEGITLTENGRMLSLARSLGFKTSVDPDDRQIVLMRRAL